MEENGLLMRQIIFYVVIVMSLTVTAQTQQGIVKTRGRVVNGALLAGQGLSGATVRVRGHNAVVSAQNGGFNMNLGSPNYLLQSVTKQGYQLVDMEVSDARLGGHRS